MASSGWVRKFTRPADVPGLADASTWGHVQDDLILRVDISDHRHQLNWGAAAHSVLLSTHTKAENVSSKEKCPCKSLRIIIMTAPKEPHLPVSCALHCGSAPCFIKRQSRFPSYVGWPWDLLWPTDYGASERYLFQAWDLRGLQPLLSLSQTQGQLCSVEAQSNLLEDERPHGGKPRHLS